MERWAKAQNKEKEKLRRVIEEIPPQQTETPQNNVKESGTGEYLIFLIIYFLICLKLVFFLKTIFKV